MKRSPAPKRVTPLKRSTKPIKRSPITRKKGKPKRFAVRRVPEYAAWIRNGWCILGGACEGFTEAAHVRSRGAGGDDVGNLVRLCKKHHAEQHTLGIRSFQRKYCIDMKLAAETLALQWKATHD